MQVQKILIADDEPQIRRLLEVALRKENYTVFLARTGAEALRAARAHRPDLVLLDVSMPGELDGHQVCRRLKSDPLTAGIRIIVLTASRPPGPGEESVADGYLEKPFLPSELIRRIRELD